MLRKTYIIILSCLLCLFIGIGSLSIKRLKSHHYKNNHSNTNWKCIEDFNEISCDTDGTTKAALQTNWASLHTPRTCMCMAGWQTLSPGIYFPPVQKDPCKERSSHYPVSRSASHRGKLTAGRRGRHQNHSEISWAQPGIHHSKHLFARYQPGWRDRSQFHDPTIGIRNIERKSDSC